MAKQAVVEKPGLVARMKEFVQEVKLEMSKVTWPSKEELKSSTQVVLVLLVILAAIIYVYDVAFQLVVVQLLSL